MSWFPTNPIPREFADVLFDEDDDNELDIEDMPVLFEREDGSLMNIEAEEEDPPLIYDDDDEDDYFEILEEEVVARQTSSPPGDSDEETEEELEEARAFVYATMSPLTSPIASPLRDLSPVAGPSSLSPALPARGRGGPSTRGRGRGGRGRGRGRGRSTGTPRARGQSGGVGAEGEWQRGDLLQHRFVNDDELPDEVTRLVAARERRERNAERTSNVRRANGEESEVENLMSEIGASEGFTWRGMDEWNGTKESFVPPQPAGPTRLVDSPYEALCLIWTDDIITHIVDETNRYAQLLVENRARFARDWYETNSDEIWTLFAFWMMIGIIRMPTIKSCFTNIPMLRTDVFRQLFTESRYWNLNAAFHLVEGTNRDDVLHPMGPVLDHLNDKFKELYQPGQEISIDESLTLWKGPVAFKQYIKTKAARFGIKTYQLCESSTGYLWSFFVYIGRAASVARQDEGAAVVPAGIKTVCRLIRPLLNFGHTLYMDNWFNSPPLARWLKRNKTDCVGTLNPARKEVPLQVRKCPLQQGQLVARASDDVMVVALHDKKRVTCISTFHDVSQVEKAARPGHPRQYKLKLIDDYNHGMGGVDRLDQMLEPYLVERKQCVKWTRKLFKRLLNVSIQNARILVEKSTNTKIDALSFRLALVQDIMNRHVPNVPQRRPAGQRNPVAPLLRPDVQHFIRRIPITDEDRQKVVYRSNLGRRQCQWCNKTGKRTRTSYECEQCQLALCLESCFKEYHLSIRQ